ncbi:MAG: hypothetical protein ACOYT4_02625 [Nanoarchaeota archaeon]
MKNSYIILAILSVVILIGLVSAEFSPITGNAVWGLFHCSTKSKCPAGEGDCDSNSECLTGWCHYNVGGKYGQSSDLDVCECNEGTIWSPSSKTCVLNNSKIQTQNQTQTQNKTQNVSGGSGGAGGNMSQTQTQNQTQTNSTIKATGDTILMKSPNGKAWKCGPNDSGNWNCIAA